MKMRPYVEAELAAARDAGLRGDIALEFSHLENAHVLGQESTWLHVKAHWRMLCWGIRNARPGECLGQVIRIVGAATKTAIGWVPAGNTGGANVSPFKAMPIKTELAEIIHDVKNHDQDD